MEQAELLKSATGQHQVVGDWVKEKFRAGADLLVSVVDSLGKLLPGAIITMRQPIRKAKRFLHNHAF
jgi:hypothetical protein